MNKLAFLSLFALLIASVYSESTCAAVNGMHLLEFQNQDDGLFYNQTLQIGVTELISDGTYSLQVMNTVCANPSRPGVLEGCITGVAWGTDTTSYAVIYDPVSGHIIYENNGIAVPYQKQRGVNGLTLFPLSSGGYYYSIDYNFGSDNPTITGWFSPTGSFITLSSNNPYYYDLTTSACLKKATPTAANTAGGSFFDKYSAGVQTTQYTARSQLYPVNPVLPTFPRDFTPAALAHCKLAQYGPISNHGRYFCLVDFDLYGPAKTAIYGDFQNMACNTYCISGGSSSNGIEGQMNCDAAVCDWPLFRMNNNGFFSPLVHYEDGKLVPVVEPMRAGSGWKQSFLAPMGGAYTFAVDTRGYCGSGVARNVTVNVNCYSAIRANAGTNMTLNIEEHGAYAVKLSGSVSGDLFSDNLHVSWKFLSVPSATALSQMQILPPNVLSPIFLANAAGTYVVELTAFDGCSLSRSVIGITVKCLNISFYTTTDSLSMNQRSFVFDHATRNHDTESFYLAPVCQNFNPAASWLPMLYTAYKAFATTLVRVDPLPTPLYMAKTSSGNVDTYKIQLSIYNQVNLTTFPPVTAPQTCGKTQSTTNTPFADHAEIASYTIIDECVSNNLISQATTVTYDKLARTECSITVNNQYSAFQVGVTPSPAFSNMITVADLVDTMNTSALTQLVNRFYPYQWGTCVGKYQLLFDNITHPLLCGTRKVAHNFEVQCDHPSRVPQANTLSPCWDVRYQYSAPAGWPTVNLRGEDGRRNPVLNMLYSWYLYTKPAGSGLSFPLTANTASSTTFVPDMEGLYQFKYAVGDWCAVETEVRSVNTVCTESLTEVRWTCPASLQYNYADTTQNVAHMYINVTSSATAKYGTTVGYVDSMYTVAGSPLSVSGTFADRSLGFSGFGTWIAQVTASDGCRKITKNCTFSVTCPNTVTAGFTVAGSPVVYNQSRPANKFPAFLVTDTSSSAQPTTRRLYVDGGFWGTPTTNTPVSVSTPGTHAFRLVVTDACGVSKDFNASVVANCATNVLTPYIQMNVTSELDWEDWNGKTITLSAEKSTAGILDGITWNVLSYQWYITGIDGSITKPTTVTTPITLSNSQCGQYLAILEIGDGCKKANASLLIHLKCRNQVTSVASVASNSVTFNGVKFPKVQLSGVGSSTGTLLPSAVTWTWTVLEAPAGSSFFGRDMQNISTYVIYKNDVQKGTETAVGSPHPLRYTQTNTTRNQVAVHKITKYSVLVNDAYRPASFGSCFRPDLPGYYALELQLKGQCPADVSTSKVYINALCQAAPTVSAEIYSLNSANVKIANTYLYQKVFFDASATTIAPGTNSQLSYTWTLSYCAADTLPVDVTTTILNQKSAKAQWWPTKTGPYCLNLNVTDGCQTISRDWTFSVTCSEVPPAAPTPLASYTLDGFGNQIVTMQMDEATHVTKNNPFLYTYEWKLTKFKPNGIF